MVGVSLEEAGRIYKKTIKTSLKRPRPKTILYFLVILIPFLLFEFMPNFNKRGMGYLIMVFSVLAVLFILVYLLSRYLNKKNIPSNFADSLEKEVINEKPLEIFPFKYFIKAPVINLECKKIKNLSVTYSSLDYSPNWGLFFGLRNPFRGFIFYDTMSGIQSKTGRGENLLFSVILKNSKPKHQKYSILKEKEKIKNNLIINPLIRRLIKRHKPKWAKNKKIKTMDFEKTGNYYMLSLSVDKDFAINHAKEVYNLLYVLGKELEK